MNSKLPVTNSNGNEYRHCGCCEKYLPLSSFSINGKSYRTCNTCRIKSKEVYQRKKQKINVEPVQIELIELCDFLSEILNSFENGNGSENKENVANPEFTFSCVVNINTLEGSSKEKANYIIKEISDVEMDEVNFISNATNISPFYN